MTAPREGLTAITDDLQDPLFLLIWGKLFIELCQKGCDTKHITALPHPHTTIHKINI